MPVKVLAVIGDAQGINAILHAEKAVVKVKPWVSWQSQQELHRFVTSDPCHRRIFAHASPLEFDSRAILFKFAMTDAKFRCANSLTPAIAGSHVQYHTRCMIPNK